MFRQNKGHLEQNHAHVIILQAMKAAKRYIDHSVYQFYKWCINTATLQVKLFDFGCGKLSHFCVPRFYVL